MKGEQPPQERGPNQHEGYRERSRSRNREDGIGGRGRGLPYRGGFRGDRGYSGQRGRGGGGFGREFEGEEGGFQERRFRGRGEGGWRGRGGRGRARNREGAEAFPVRAEESPLNLGNSPNMGGVWGEQEEARGGLASIVQSEREEGGAIAREMIDNSEQAEVGSQVSYASYQKGVLDIGKPLEQEEWPPKQVAFDDPVAPPLNETPLEPIKEGRELLGEEEKKNHREPNHFLEVEEEKERDRGRE